MKCLGFIYGFCLGQAYYYYLLKPLPFPYHIGAGLNIFISLLLAIGNAVSIQIRCICLLIYPMYCGKAGRGVLKGVILTYVVAGPITNMGMNAREVVRVFACSTQLSFNLSKAKYNMLVEPFRRTAISLENEIDKMKDTFSSIGDISAPIEHEIEDMEEITMKQNRSDQLDDVLCINCRSKNIEEKYRIKCAFGLAYRLQKFYQKKLEYRCDYQLTEAVALCFEAFATAYENCYNNAPAYTAWILCWPLKVNHVCNFMLTLTEGNLCDSSDQMDRGFIKGYISLKKAKQDITNSLNDVRLHRKVTFESDLYDIQDAKETGERVMRDFEEKHRIMSFVIIALNACIALLFLRILTAAITYHEMFLTSIEYDNVYVTKYFKKLDERRKNAGEMTLLPLKKMERSKYIDVNSKLYKGTQHGRLITQVLKVMLEVVTATTFVMLDRLFYEALDVVRQHAEVEDVQPGQDLTIEVVGTGMLATLIRKLISGFVSQTGHDNVVVTNNECLPHPSAMPPIYFFKIYGGYMWILLLLCINPYTLRLRRSICSYFYPGREKQRVLHLYNDILKKRMKMQKTLRRKAVQAVRAHYLAGENLLSLRMKFPSILGWLHTLPAARMTCLICGETEPRTSHRRTECWHSCGVPKCPFVYCRECWLEAGAHCLACDPSLNELSDVDSLSDEESPPF